MTYLITPHFEEVLGSLRLDSLNNLKSTVYGLDSDFNISYLNPEWFSFADQNGDKKFVHDEWSLGRNIFDCIPKVLEPFYRSLYNTILDEKNSTVAPKQSEYECSSPTLYRHFAMHLYSMGKEGIIVVNSLLVDEPHAKQSSSEQHVFKDENYIDKNGILHQCANCRRIVNLTNQGQWDWIPKFISNIYPKTSHGICSICMKYYYLV